MQLQSTNELMLEVAFEVHCPALFSSISNKSHMKKSSQRPQDY